MKNIVDSWNNKTCYQCQFI